MNVRLTEHSIRFRITPSELQRLVEGGALACCLMVRGGGWSAEIRPASGKPRLVWFDRGPVLMLGPEEIATLESYDTEGVSLDLAERRVSVEKDFPRAHPHPPDTWEPEPERLAPLPSHLARIRESPAAETHVR